MKNSPKEIECFSTWRQTYEMVIRGKISIPLPAVVPLIHLWNRTLGSSYYLASTLGKQINLLIVRIERLHIIGKLNFREIVTERDRKEIGKNSFKIERNEFELLLVRTEHYKRSFLNRCLFEFV